jgi:hypothetical protein
MVNVPVGKMVLYQGVVHYIVSPEIDGLVGVAPAQDGVGGILVHVNYLREVAV